MINGQEGSTNKAWWLAITYDDVTKSTALG
jgi:hypothetical protein